MREIKFYYTSTGNSPVEEFLESLTVKQVKKVLWTLRIVRDVERVSSRYFEKLVNTNEIWEVRVQSGNNIFRILGFYDDSNRIVLTNAFAKKTQKIPIKEIKLAEQRKREYYERKK